MILPALALACSGAFAAQRPLPPLPRPAITAPPPDAGLPAPAEAAVAAGALADEALAAFIERRAGEGRRRRLDLFLVKMRKSAASDFDFFRGMPDLFYDLLARSPEAGELRASPELLLDGDPHAENVELVDYKGKPLPQFADLDDAGPGPAALDMARMLGGAAALGRTDAERRELAAQAKQAYLASLALPFDTWRKAAASEAAVDQGPAEDRRWRSRGGAPVADKALAGRLFKLSGLDPERWIVLDRAGAGLSSIGLRRYLFAHRTKDHARELKELRAPATAVFTGRAARKQGPRVARAYATLRQSPVELTTPEGLGAEWMLRRREAEQRSLDLSHPRSAARTLGGLLAQVHRGQADVRALARSMQAIEEKSVVGWLCAMGRMRDGLGRLLASGRWDRP